MLVLLYLMAIVLANISVTLFGAQVSIITAFVLVSLDLTTRDALHERWEHRNLRRNMLLLIGGGSLLSALINLNALPIALASFVAFAAAGVADTLIYSLLGNRSRFIRINGSNVVSAAVDSLIFPLLAFGWPLLWGIVIGQFVAKVLGGALWFTLLTARNQPAIAQVID